MSGPGLAAPDLSFTGRDASPFQIIDLAVDGADELAVDLADALAVEAAPSFTGADGAVARVFAGMSLAED